MKKLALAVLAAATLVTNGAFAQSQKPRANTGSNATKAGTYTTDGFSWGIALGTLVVVGTIVGVTVAAATTNANSK